MKTDRSPKEAAQSKQSHYSKNDQIMPLNPKAAKLVRTLLGGRYSSTAEERRIIRAHLQQAGVEV
jgi:hypothetical protein